VLVESIRGKIVAVAVISVAMLVADADEMSLLATF
jgi:hypothetical protein